MPTQVPYSELRCSDAERERVVAFLREHALAGRLHDDELEDRIGLAYAAVTVGDLQELIGDLPRAQRHTPAPRPSRPPRPVRQQKNCGPSPLLIIAGIAVIVFTGLPLVIISGIVAVVAVVLALSFALGPFLLIALLIVLASRRRKSPPPMRWGPQH
jgi:uncharacterized protein DUF1707